MRQLGVILLFSVICSVAGAATLVLPMDIEVHKKPRASSPVIQVLPAGLKIRYSTKKYGAYRRIYWKKSGRKKSGYINIDLVQAAKLAKSKTPLFALGFSYYYSALVQPERDVSTSTTPNASLSLAVAQGLGNYLLFAEHFLNPQTALHFHYGQQTSRFESQLSFSADDVKDFAVAQTYSVMGFKYKSYSLDRQKYWSLEVEIFNAKTSQVYEDNILLSEGENLPNFQAVKYSKGWFLTLGPLILEPELKVGVFFGATPNIFSFDALLNSSFYF